MGLGALSAINIGIAFALNWLVFTGLGPGSHTDALFAAMTVPQVLLTVITGSLTRVMVPILSGESDHELRRDAWTFLWIVAAISVPLAIALGLSAPWWVPWTIPGFSGPDAGLTTAIARVHLIGMVLAAASGVQLGVCQAKRQYLRAEGAVLVCGCLGLMVLAVTLPSLGVLAAAWVNVGRMGLLLVVLMPSMGRASSPVLARPAVRDVWSRIKPLLWGSAYYKTEPLVDRLLLSSSASGTISLYLLAQQAYGAISQLIGKAITAPLLTELSALHKCGDSVEFRRLYRHKLAEMMVIGLTGVLGLILFGRPMLHALFGHGRMSAESITQLWWIMVWLAGMFVGGVMGQVATNAFLSTGDTVTPARLSAITYTVYLPCKILGFHFFGVSGLAVMTSIYYLANLVAQVVAWERLVDD